MKKIITIAISTILASAMFAATSVTLNNTSSDLIVELNSDSDIYGIQFDLRYDSSKLSIDASSVTGAEDVYAADKGNGIVRVLMFDFDGQPLSAKAGTHLINLPFELTGSSDISALLEFTGELIVAGYNGEKLDASFEDYYLTVDSELPNITSLSKNYPNPFNPSTTINYSVSTPGHVSLVIYDLNGATVKTLVNEFVGRNNYSIKWDGRNSSGQSVASGQYFYVMKAPGGFTSTEYMTLLK
jgi:hypothetical protein